MHTTIFSFFSDYEEIVVIVLISFVLLISLLFIKKPIDTVYDNDDTIIFRIYQAKTGFFTVRGYHGYTRYAFFKRYTDVATYIDKHINGWS